MSHQPLQTRMLITIKRPERWLLAMVLIVLLVMAGFWSAYEYGLKKAGYDRSEAISTMDELQQQLEDARAQISESQRQTAMLERNNKIDGDTSSQIKESLAKAQAEVLELKKELTFYKSIVTPEDTKRSVAIQTIQLKKNELGGFDYQIMVSQRGRNDRFIRGNLDVTVNGDKLGKHTSLKLSSISSEAKRQKTFGFKYFQKFEGTLKLPESFVPESVRVQVKPSSSGIDPIDEQFAWADLTAGGAQNVGQQ